MSTTIKALWGTLLLAILFGVFALSFWGIPAPITTVIKVVPPSQYMQKPKSGSSNN